MSTTERLSQAIDHLGSADVQGREWDTAVTRLLMRAVEWRAAGCPGKEPARARRSALETLGLVAAEWGLKTRWSRPDTGGYFVSLDAEVKDGSMLRGVATGGRSAEAAAAELLSDIEGKNLVVDAYNTARRELRLPMNLRDWKP